MGDFIGKRGGEGRTLRETAFDWSGNPPDQLPPGLSAWPRYKTPEARLWLPKKVTVMCMMREVRGGS